MIVINLLQRLSEKAVGKKGKLKVCFSFAYNPYVFPRSDFMNYMSNSGIVHWEITPREISKNGQDY